MAAATRTIVAARKLSVGKAVGARLSRGSSAPKGKLLAWVGDAYQILWVALTAILLATASSGTLPPWLAWTLGAVLTYRLSEMSFFLLGWILIDEGPLHSYRRSVVGFFLNALEVALAAATLDALSGCSALPVFDAFWTHLSTLMSLDGGDVLDRTGACRAIPVARFGFGAVIMLLALATIAGGLIRAEVEHDRE